MRAIKKILAQGIGLCMMATSVSSHAAFAADEATQLINPNHSSSDYLGRATLTVSKPEPDSAQRSKRANFDQESASPDARHVADWVVDSGDNRSMPFVILDKKEAKVFVFHADGRLRGAAPALLGLALGDNSVPGIGSRKLSSIRPDERTTPAGRFVAALGHNLRGEEILWVDYDGAIALHRVITSNPNEHRAQRLASPTPLDKRISYGCINVPAKFYDTVVSPEFTGTRGIVYVLPDASSIRKVFPSYGVYENERGETDRID
jgi:hypothetical protein